MTQVECTPTFVLFGGSPATVEDGAGQASGGEAPDYLRRRENAERAAAKRARSAVARGLHQDLAQRYASLRMKLAT